MNISDDMLVKTYRLKYNNSNYNPNDGIRNLMPSDTMIFGSDCYIYSTNTLLDGKYAFFKTEEGTVVSLESHYNGHIMCSPLKALDWGLFSDIIPISLEKTEDTLYYSKEKEGELLGATSQKGTLLGSTLPMEWILDDNCTLPLTIYSNCKLENLQNIKFIKKKFCNFVTWHVLYNDHTVGVAILQNCLFKMGDDYGLGVFTQQGKMVGIGNWDMALSSVR